MPKQQITKAKPAAGRRRHAGEDGQETRERRPEVREDVWRRWFGDQASGASMATS